MMEKDTWTHEEEPIRFDFSLARSVFRHDRRSDQDDGNTFWSGVDFRILDDSIEIWLEVKSWRKGRAIGKSAQKGFELAFLRESESGELREELMRKFLGSSCFLAWSGIGLPNMVLYVILLEPPDRTSLPLVSAMRDRFGSQFRQKNVMTWGEKRIGHRILTLDEFKERFPQYPAWSAGR